MTTRRPAAPKPNRTLDALKLIQSQKVFSAEHFAKLFWPDNLAHKRHYKGGNGTAVGKGAWLMAGSFVAKLRKKGLVNVFHGWSMNERSIRDKLGWVTVTREGRKYIEEHDQADRA